MFCKIWIRSEGRSYRSKAAVKDIRPRLYTYGPRPLCCSFQDMIGANFFLLISFLVELPLFSDFLCVHPFYDHHCNYFSSYVTLFELWFLYMPFHSTIAFATVSQVMSHCLKNHPTITMYYLPCSSIEHLSFPIIYWHHSLYQCLILVAVSSV